MAIVAKKTSNQRRKRKSPPSVALRLESLSYSEFSGEPKEWTLKDASFDQINLIVGRNSSGKTRFLNLIAGLASLLSGKRGKVFRTGIYKCVFTSGEGKQTYDLEIRNGEVVRELFSIDDRNLLKRGKNGAGVIWAEKIGAPIDFETPPDQLAARVRRDSIQHPFFEDLHTWASGLRHYLFGTPLGRDRLLMIADAIGPVGKAEAVTESNDVVKLYASAYEEFGPKFDQRILSDLGELGYKCTEVGLEPIDNEVLEVKTGPLAWLFVQEDGLQAKTTQGAMSQGMFRALSLVIHLNYLVLRKTPRTILIDDIGEGLDFSRAQAFITLLIERSAKSGLQLIMTTNDRFVMNGVPLEHWGVLRRNGSSVSLVNCRNSPKVFSDFKELGLNNFEFFSNSFFDEGLR